MNLLLIAGESSEIVRGKPTDEDYRNGLVIQTFQNVSYERKTFPNHFVLIKDFNNSCTTNPNTSACIAFNVSQQKKFSQNILMIV